MKNDVDKISKDTLVKLFYCFTSYANLYETFYVMIHDEIVKVVTTLSNEELDLIKQPLLVKKDLFHDSPLLQLIKK
jgi:hypothetical protein